MCAGDVVKGNEEKLRRTKEHGDARGRVWRTACWEKSDVRCFMNLTPKGLPLEMSDFPHPEYDHTHHSDHTHHFDVFTSSLSLISFFHV